MRLRVRQLDHVAVELVIVIAEAGVEGEIEDGGDVEVFEKSMPGRIIHAAERDVKIIAGEKHAMEFLIGRFHIRRQISRDFALVGRVASPIAHGQQVDLAARGNAQQKE